MRNGGRDAGLVRQRNRFDGLQTEELIDAEDLRFGDFDIH